MAIMLPNTSSLTERLQEMQTSWMEGLGVLRRRRWERGGGGICREIHGKTRDQTCLHTTASDSEVTCKLMRDTSRYTLAVMATVAGELLSVLLDVHARITPRTPSITAPPRVDASNSGGQRSMSGKPRPRRFKKKNENKMTMRAPLTELSSGGVCGGRAKHRFHTIHCLVPAKASLFENICFGRILSRMTDLSHKEMAAE